MIFDRRISQPKVCLPQAAAGPASLGGNDVFPAGPNPSYIDSTLPSFGVTLGPGKDQGKTSENLSMDSDIPQEQEQGQPAHTI